MKRFELALAGAGLAVMMAMVGCSEDDNINGGASLDPNATDAGALPPGPGLDASVNDPNTDAAGNMVDGACGGTMMKATARDANMLLVIDKSGSMLQRPDGFAVKKWDAVKIALRDSLTPMKGKMSLGLEMFPNDTSGAGDQCAMPGGGAGVTIPIGPGTVDKIIASVNGASPGGATPTAKALADAHAYFATGAGKDLVGDRYIILATDGGPNCGTMASCGADMCTTNIDGSCMTGGNCCDPASGGSRSSCLDADAVVDQLNALRSIGVKTFVIGIPGTEAYKTYLDRFAEAGGMVNAAGPNKYYSVTASGGVAGLTSVFALITGELITSCRITLDETVPDPTNLNVYVDETVIPQGGANGWEFDTTTTPPSIVIKGSTCETVKSKGAKAISVVYGCPTLR